MARVDGGRVRALAWRPAPALDRDGPDAIVEADVEGCENHPPPTLGDQWRWFREELGMLTFFLLDPESWR
jgi:hypothetical protein